MTFRYWAMLGILALIGLVAYDKQREEQAKQEALEREQVEQFLQGYQTEPMVADETEAATSGE